MWHLAIEMRSRFPELPMICDPSHICGCRTYLQEVAQKSADLDYDGLIIESPYLSGQGVERRFAAGYPGRVEGVAG